METVSKKEIMEKMEKMKPAEMLKFRLAETFGGKIVSVEINPLFGQKQQRKYLMRSADDEAMLKKIEPLIRDDKTKKIADWISGRAAVWASEAQSRPRAA